MSAKRRIKDHPYGLMDTVVESILNVATTHEEVFGEGGIYRVLVRH